MNHRSFVVFQYPLLNEKSKDLIKHCYQVQKYLSKVLKAWLVYSVLIGFMLHIISSPQGEDDSITDYWSWESSSLSTRVGDGVGQLCLIASLQMFILGCGTSAPSHKHAAVFQGTPCLSQEEGTVRDLTAWRRKTLGHTSSWWWPHAGRLCSLLAGPLEEFPVGSVVSMTTIVPCDLPTFTHSFHAVVCLSHAGNLHFNVLHSCELYKKRHLWIWPVEKSGPLLWLLLHFQKNICFVVIYC